VRQLAPDGRLVIPVGTPIQTLCVVTRTASGTVTENYDRCVYVPLRGAAGGHD
jgi:protein-L-isoaspartate O-methyltransferase